MYLMDLRESYQRRNPWMPVPSGRPRDLVGSGHAGLTALLGAVFWVDAGQSPVGGGYIKNLGTGGSVLDARFGSTTGTDTNDPSLLPHSGVNYLYLPGVAGNYASAPDSAALDITGDIDLIYRGAAGTFAAQQYFINKNGTGTNGGYALGILSSGFLMLRWSDGAAGFTATSTQSLAAAGLVVNRSYWWRATLDVDNGAGGYQVRLYWAADDGANVVPTSWTEFTTPAAGVGVTSIAANATQLAVGSWHSGASDNVTGDTYRAIVRNGIGGTTVFDADFTRGITSGSQTSFTEFSSNAATVTINRSTSGRKAVAVVRPVLLLGTDDYLEVADNALLDFALTDSFTAVGLVREWTNAGTLNRSIVAKFPSAGGQGWGVFSSPTRQAVGQVNDGLVNVTRSSAATATDGALFLAGAVVDRASQMSVYVNNTAVTQSLATLTTTSANALPMRIGAYSDGTFSDLEFVAAAVFRRALTAAEIASIVAYYGAS